MYIRNIWCNNWLWKINRSVMYNIRFLFFFFSFWFVRGVRFSFLFPWLWFYHLLFLWSIKLLRKTGLIFQMYPWRRIDCLWLMIPLITWYELNPSLEIENFYIIFQNMDFSSMHHYFFFFSFYLVLNLVLILELEQSIIVLFC